jgi:hypothetical protein
MNILKLPIAEQASFDSRMEEHNPKCLDKTRVEVRKSITEWAYDADSKCIFWLNGMAGTGKSTIARTMAHFFADNRQLGGSFFFKKGEGDRGNATKFFTTIANQLASSIPVLASEMQRVIEAEPNIPHKSLKDQFEKLILQPLLILQQNSPEKSVLVIVIDALDECDRDEDIRTILLHLGRAKDVSKIRVRLLVTSRPELPIRLGFKRLPGLYQDIILHEVPKEIIQHDILAFLETELRKIQKDRNLSLDWPSGEDVWTLTEMATPLFIFAATVCRFIADSKRFPKTQLNTILRYHTKNNISKLDKTYLPILDQLFSEQDEIEQQEVAKGFREVVGPIIILASPLSIVSLASLLDISEDEITCKLDLLHSVLNVPNEKNKPIRLLHLSFRDFLLDPKKEGQSPFWIDERGVHIRLTTMCLQLLLKSKHLKKDICDLQKPGTRRNKIDRKVIERCLPQDIQYACRYWVYHLEQSKSQISDNDQVHAFLRERLLYWLESLSIMGNISESISMIERLQSIAMVSLT